MSTIKRFSFGAIVFWSLALFLFSFFDAIFLLSQKEVSTGLFGISHWWDLTAQPLSTFMAVILCQMKERRDCPDWFKWSITEEFVAFAFVVTFISLFAGIALVFLTELPIFLGILALFFYSRRKIQTQLQ